MRVRFAIFIMGVTAAGIASAQLPPSPSAPAGAQAASAPPGTASHDAAQGGFTADIHAETNAMVAETDHANRQNKPIAPGTKNAENARGHEQPPR